MAEKVASLYVELEARTNDLERDLKRAERSLENTGKSARSSGLRFTELNSALGFVTSTLGIVSGAARQAYNVINEGAQLELAKDRFDNLTASIGTTSSAMLNELGAATGGMMSNADMIASASQIISLGLGGTKEEVVDLASLTSQLGWDMQQVIMTFANNSKARLDALGLSVTDVEERMKTFEQQGYDTDKAFDMAVIEAGKDKLELLGSAADTTAGKLQIVAARFADVTNAAKTGVALGFAPMIDSLALTLTAEAKLDDMVARRIITQEQATRLGWEVIRTDKTREELLEDLVRIEDTYNTRLQERKRREQEIVNAYRESGWELREYTGNLEDLSQAGRDAMNATNEHKFSLEELKRIAEATGIPLEQLARTYNVNITDNLGDVDQRAHGVGLTLRGLPTDHTFTLHLRTDGMLPTLGGPTGVTGGGAGAVETGLGGAASPSAEVGGQQYTGNQGAGEMILPDPPPSAYVPPGGWGPSGPPEGDQSRAAGGPAYAGRPYVVGERGPELFIPREDGNVVNNSQMGGNTYNFSIDGRLLAQIQGGRMTAGMFAEQVGVRG